MHASAGLQNPLHSGASASPHAVVRHSQSPPEATAEQCPPSPHVPVQRRSCWSNSHCPAPASVVVVVLVPTGAGARLAGMHTWSAFRYTTTREPPSSSVVSADDLGPFGHLTR
jgi:hypothetical protein